MLRARVIRLDRFPQQLGERVLRAEIEIIGGQCRLRREFRVRQIRRADLRAGDVAFDLTPHAPPHIRCPGYAALDTVHRAVALAPADRHTRGTARPTATASRHAAVRRDGGEQSGARLTHQRDGGAILRLELLHGLVGHLHHPLQPVELRIVVDRPPRALVTIVARLADFPTREFLERGRRRRVGPFIVRADHAAAGRQSQRQDSNECAPHSAGPGVGAAPPRAVPESRGNARCQRRRAARRKRSR